MEDLYWGGAALQPPSPEAVAAAAATVAPSPLQPPAQAAAPVAASSSSSSAINEQRRLRARAGVQSVMSRLGLLSDDQVTAATQEVERRQRESRPGIRGGATAKAGSVPLQEGLLQRKRAALTAASALAQSLPAESLSPWVAWRDGLLPAAAAGGALALPADFSPGRLGAWATERRADLDR